jgi:hypothetical protein
MAENHNKENELKPQRPAPVRGDPNPVKRTPSECGGAQLPAVKLNLTKTLTVINEMQAAGVIGRYAIGGAVGATFYLEPVPTMDVDIFVAMNPVAGHLIITPEPIYEYLIARGYTAVGDALKVEDWLVQFLPPPGPLVEEGIAQALEVAVETVRTFVLTAEHLVAVALQTGRPKDKARILQFLEAGALDQERLRDILKRHGLFDRWVRFEQTFLGK